MLTELFSKCAYRQDYKQIGDSVNYAIDEDEKNKTLSVYFQGSNSITDWVRNFLFTKDCYGLFKAHKGFLMAYKEVRNLLLDKIYEQDENGDYKWLKIIIVGYSHGGALTQLFLQDCWYHRPDIKDCILAYAFETPRALKVKKKYRFFWNNLTRVENNWDLVAHCPPKFVGYSDLGHLIKVKGDTSMVRRKLPKCIKSHFAECVLDGLRKFEH